MHRGTAVLIRQSTNRQSANRKRLKWTGIRYKAFKLEKTSAKVGSCLLLLTRNVVHIKASIRR